MSRQISRELSQRSEIHALEADRCPADVEMERVLKTSPLRKASDLSSGVLAYWKRDVPRDVVEPMADRVPSTPGPARWNSSLPTASRTVCLRSAGPGHRQPPVNLWTSQAMTAGLPAGCAARSTETGQESLP